MASGRAITKAKHIAGDDYVVLLADVYGKGVRPKNDDEARAVVKKLYDDRAALRARANKAIEVLRTAKTFPSTRTTSARSATALAARPALEMARSGAEPRAVAPSMAVWRRRCRPSPHGEGERPRAQRRRRPGHEGRHPAFENEMNAAKVDWQFVNFRRRVHCFALPDGEQAAGLRLQRAGERRSERMMRVFFAEKVRQLTSRPTE
jgi:dienelactone hydrolase